MFIRLLPTNRRLISVLLLAAAACLLIYQGCSWLDAAVDRDQPSSTALPTETYAWPHEAGDLTPDPDIRMGRLTNGFRYALKENHNPENRVSAHLIIQSGSFHEAEDQQGFAHFLEHMLFNGSTHFGPGELVKYFQEIGMDFGPDANARTGLYETVYDLLLPAGNPESIRQGLIVLRDYADGALLLPSEIDRERKVVLAEKRSRDSVSYRTFEATLAFQMPEARISRRLPIGKEDALATADHYRLRTFYDTWYRPERMVLVMVGDFDMEAAEQMVGNAFGDMASRAEALPEPPSGRIEHHGINIFHHHEREAGNTEVSIEAFRLLPTETDTYRLRQEKLKQDIANRIVQDRLNQLVNNPDAPITSAHIGSGRFWRNVEYAGISAECNPEKWSDTLELLEASLRRAWVHGFTESEFKRVQKDFLNTLETDVKQASTRDSKKLAHGIIRGIGRAEVFLSPQQEKELFYDYIRTLKKQSIHEAFQRSWEPDHRLILVTGNAAPQNDQTNPEAQILAAYEESAKTVVKKAEETEKIVFPYLPEPPAKGVIIRQEWVEDLGVRQVVFENGVRLNLKKTDFEADSIQFILSTGSGRSTEPEDLPGLAYFAEAVVNGSGLGRMDKDQLEIALAGKNTTVSFHVDNEKFFFAGKSVPGESTLFMQLLRAQLIDPGFREDALVLAKERFGQEYASMSRSIENAYQLFIQRFLAGGDSRFGFPHPPVLPKITLASIRDWLPLPIENPDVELSVVGDFDTEEIIELAALYLGSIKNRPSKQKNAALRTDPSFPRAEYRDIDMQTKIQKGLVIVAFPTADIWDISRTRRLNILARIFSDRIRERIREKLGAAYSPYAYNQASRVYKGYGVLETHIIINPAESAKVIAEVTRIASDMAENGVTTEELKRAIEPTMTSLKEYLTKNSYWLHTVLNGCGKYPQQLEWSGNMLTDYASITREEISFLAADYLNVQQSATISVTPKNRGPSEPN